MARQPLGRFIRITPRLTVNFEPSHLSKKTKLVSLVGQIVIAWSVVESELGALLGLLLKADSAASLAVFQILRRSSSQRDAIDAAGKVRLDDEELLLLRAILNVHKSVEAERNSLVHGHLGICSKVPKGLIWMSNEDFIRSNVQHLIERNLKLSDLVPGIYVYRESDLMRIFKDVYDAWGNLSSFNYHLQDKYIHSSVLGDGLCDQLRAKPRIRQELAILRQKTASSSTGGVQ